MRRGVSPVFPFSLPTAASFFVSHGSLSLHVLTFAFPFRFFADTLPAKDVETPEGIASGLLSLSREEEEEEATEDHRSLEERTRKSRSSLLRRRTFLFLLDEVEVLGVLEELRGVLLRRE